MWRWRAGWCRDAMLWCTFWKVCNPLVQFLSPVASATFEPSASAQISNGAQRSSIWKSFSAIEIIQHLTSLNSEQFILDQFFRFCKFQLVSIEKIPNCWILRSPLYNFVQQCHKPAISWCIPPIGRKSGDGPEPRCPRAERGGLMLQQLPAEAMPRWGRLGMGVAEIVGRYKGDIWEISGRYLGDIWEISGYVVVIGEFFAGTPSWLMNLGWKNC